LIYYNLVTMQSLNISSSIQGRTFVGGDLVSTLSGTFGAAGAPSSQVSLEVAGTVNGNGDSITVNGNVFVSTVLNVVVDGSPTTVNGKTVLARNGVVKTDASLGSRSTKIQVDLQSLATKIGALPSTGLCTADATTETLVCRTRAGRAAVFEVTAAMLNDSQLKKFSVVNDGNVDFVMINVRGSSPIQWASTKSMTGTWLTSTQGQARTIWNFVDATTVNIEGPFMGGVLATSAEIKAKAEIFGAVAAKHFRSTADISLPNMVCPGGLTLPPTAAPTSLPPSPSPTTKKPTKPKTGAPSKEPTKPPSAATPATPQPSKGATSSPTDAP
jgi:choice-of-anchor A domain-containing protein